MGEIQESCLNKNIVENILIFGCFCLKAYLQVPWDDHQGGKNRNLKTMFPVALSIEQENTHRWGKYHFMAGLQLNNCTIYK